jgi:uroporphyrinogen-III synthase
MAVAVSAGEKGLAGIRVLVTRAPHQASELTERLRAVGAEPVLVPAIEIAPPSSYAELDAAIAGLARFDLVAFTSANAVEAFAERARVLGVRPDPRRVAVVGRATERAVEAIGLKVDVVPPVFTAESLAETLAPEAARRRFLLVLVEGAPTTLRDGLVAAGAAEVRAAAAYSNRIPETSVGAVASLFGDADACPHAVTFTSASTAKNLMALLEVAGLKLPETVVRASIGPVTSRALRELGLAPHLEAKEATVAGVVEALVGYFGAP